jgi:hypothetical protein
MWTPWPLRARWPGYETLLPKRQQWLLRKDVVTTQVEGSSCPSLMGGARSFDLRHIGCIVDLHFDWLECFGKTVFDFFCDGFNSNKKKPPISLT